MGGCKAPKSPDRLRDYFNKNTGERASAQKKRRAGHTAATAEGYNIFGDGAEPQESAPTRRRLSKLQIKALNDLGLDDTATKSDVRKRYTQLVKQLHPDANQGKRNTEESFQRVVAAMKVLKTTNLG